MKRWTKRMVWLEMAELWDVAANMDTPRALGSLGVCNSLAAFLCNDTIATKLRNEIRNDCAAYIGKRLSRPRGGPYVWPCNPKGAKLRAKFCRMMAKRATKKKVEAKKKTK